MRNALYLCVHRQFGRWYARAQMKAQDRFDLGIKRRGSEQNGETLAMLVAAPEYLVRQCVSREGMQNTCNHGASNRHCVP
jgi:hypothetical protein